MHGRIPAVILFALLFAPVSGSGILAADNPAEPDKFFHEFVGLKDDQIREIHEGKAVAKVLNSPTADQVFVFGSVYIHSTPERYLKFASDLDALRKLPSYLAIRKFSDPPQLSDLTGFTMDEEDFKQLKNCKAGHCEVQLPSEAIEEFQQSVNWSAPDANDQANHLAQQMALQALLNYQQGGNAALGTYRDKNHPAVVSETFASLLNRSKALPVYMPELREYLLNYPKADSGRMQSEFFQGRSPQQPAYAVAVKQLYSSHYFESALDLTVCVKDERSAESGFYLITMKGSQQAGLTGLKGGIVRKVAVDKTRSSLEKALASIKEKLESQAK